MSGWIVETLVATTLLMLLVLLVRERVATRFGARIAYLLWLLPALRMVLPPLPDTFGPTPIEQLPVVIDLSAFSASAVHAAGALPPVDPGIDWVQILLVVWLGGAAAMMAWHLIAYRRFVRAALAEATDLPEMDRNGIEVCASKVVEGPFAAGLLVPTIVLPHDYRTRYSAEELRMAMTHEAVHHRRGDLPVNLLALALLSLHWFNPIAWRAWRAFRADQELACDAVVLDGANAEERHSYASALVKSACKRTPVAACSLNPRDELKRRLKMMRMAQNRFVSGSVLAAAMVGGGLLLTASGGIAAETTAEISKEVRVKVIAPAVKAAVAAAGVEAKAAQAAEAARPAAEAAAAHAARISVDHEQIQATVREALAESAVAREAALAEGARAREEALREAQASLAEAADVRAEALAEAHAAWKDQAHSFAIAFDGDKRSCKHRAVVVDAGGSKPARAEFKLCGINIDAETFRASQLEALVDIRKELAGNDDIRREHLAEALKAIDREIATLKTDLR